jgi:phospholipid N-methyltransferase
MTNRPTRGTGQVREHARLFRAFLANPFHTGAVMPSSAGLTRLMLDGAGLEDAHAVAELGPGTGVFTRAIERRARADALVLVFEINPDLASPLVKEFPRFRIVNDSAENIAKHLRRHDRAAVDCVVSSLPWAGFPFDLQRRLLGAVAASLRPGGRFATFAYVPACWLPAGRRFRALLDRTFDRVEVTPIVWANVPPALVYRCTR